MLNSVNGFWFVFDSVDTQNPVITNCPEQGIVVTANDGERFAAVSWPPFVVTDNSGHVDLISSNGAPGNYPIGSTTIQYVYADAQGNSATCQFPITINPGKFIL